ncbi:MAG: DNA polymerase III subunit gamma/tau [Clostridiales bacterium]|nr:DNA polymerase III subunit gamma/tau [Clostridiales bacterium]
MRLIKNKELKVGDPMEYTALYREWRPDTFDQVVGQDHVIRVLKNQITSRRISHAYLFCGPRGTGKTSTAKIFAKAINCLDPDDGNPCGHCSVCETLDSENNMDVIEMDAASSTGVEHIREIRDKIKYPPAEGKYRVYIIDEVHMLSTSAFNAFLKTLEEPPDHIVFILATTEPHRLPSTVLSRCQRFDFRRITVNVIVDRLKAITSKMGVEAEESALETIARWSEGGMRDSISLLDQCISFCGSYISENDVLDILGTASREFLFQVVNNIMEGDIASLLIQIDNLVEEGRDISVFIKDLINHLRNLLIVDICKDPSGLIDVSQSTLEQYRHQASKMNQSRIIRAIEILTELDADIKWNTKPRVMLEMAMVKICRPQDGQSLEDLMDRVAVLEKQIAQGISLSPNTVINTKNMDEKPEEPGEKVVQRDIYEKIEYNEDIIKQEQQEIANINKKEIAHKKEAKDEKDEGKAGISEEIDKTEKNRKSEKAVSDKIDIDKVWTQILKTIKKDRMGIYTLLRDTKLHLDAKNKNIVNLIFPDSQGFFVAAIEKEENIKYIEDLLAEAIGKHFKLKCYTQEDAPSSVSDDNILEVTETPENVEDEAQDDIVQKAIDIFGEEYVEVIDD